jgi:hypothetical protein
MTQSPVSRQFHITIGAAPQPVELLAHDLRLVKAALLYADGVKLCSPASSLVLSVLAIGELTPKQQLDFLETVAPLLVRKKQDADNLLAGLSRYRSLGQKKRLNRHELVFRLGFEAHLKRQWVEIREIAYKTAEDAGAEGIIRALASGVLELHTFSTPTHAEDMSDRMVSEFVEVVTKAMSDGTTYPLFDDGTGGLVSAGIREGKLAVSDAHVARARHIGLAAHLLERLPLFDLATIQEILDIRRELDRPLVRFRRAMIQFSEKIKTASWDKDFPMEAEQVFYREVEPAVLDIEDAIRSNSYLATLVRKIADKPLLVPGGSALALVVSQLSFLPDIAALCLGIGTAASPVVYDVRREWRQKQQAIEQNSLFFYYGARERLTQLA